MSYFQVSTCIVHVWKFVFLGWSITTGMNRGNMRWWKSSIRWSCQILQNTYASSRGSMIIWLCLFLVQQFSITLTFNVCDSFHCIIILYCIPVLSKMLLSPYSMWISSKWEKAYLLKKLQHIHIQIKCSAQKHVNFIKLGISMLSDG